MKLVTTNDQITAIADSLLDFPQVDMPVKHSFAPGVYMREMSAPAGTLVIGAEHRTEHFNILSKGKLRVKVDGNLMEIKAPYSFVSKAGSMKVAIVLEDMVFVTIHPTTETDVDKLEEMLFVKSEKRKAWELGQKMLKEAA